MTVEQKYYTYEDFSYEDLLTYAGLDCIVTSGVLRRISPLLSETPNVTSYDTGEPVVIKAPSILEVTEKYEHRFHEFIIDMELNGIKYDIAENTRIKERMQAELLELKTEIISCMGKEINLDSDKDLKEYLYGYLKLEPRRFTKHGAPSVDAEAMDDLMKRYPEHSWLSIIGKYGDIVSLYRTFVENYVADHVKSDGRIHPSYNLHGTSSFRITGDNPNLTQVPRGKHGYNLKTMFTVEEGCAFLTADFSSAEVKILGALSQDPSLLQAIREDLDFHSFSASKMYGLQYEEFIGVLDNKSHPSFKKYKELRQFAKA